ncbi:putative lipid II flippase FtsW [Candidatus Parcubacteria bacterium]|nr:putative lipid II flippase FtsW [Candidatus Parcubacteria bacterium]
MAKVKRVDRPFFIATVSLITAGFFIFSSASMGLLARQGVSFSTVALKQFAIGFLAGGILLIITSRIPTKFWRKYSFYIFLFAVIACVLVFLPKIGFSHGGARRWINLGSYSFQPAEILKLGAVVYFAAWLSMVKDKVKTFKWGALPLFIILGICSVLLLLQPDTDTLMVIVAALVAMFITAGGQWRYIGILCLTAIIGILVIAQFRPYIMARLTTFLDPSKDSLGAGYQIQQSLIAIGSGGVFGRGFGQSIQKFNFLPEPIGDSIFAVAAEEFGFVGSMTILCLFVFFALRGYKIASRVSDTFAMTTAVGLVTLIISQAFINMGSMLSILPLTGIPLTFISHGGSAMLFALAEAGIILSISKNQRA